jgi:hypothetical protein
MRGAQTTGSDVSLRHSNIPDRVRSLPRTGGIADADVEVHLLRIGGIGPPRPNPGGYAPESQLALAGPEPMTTQPLDRSGLSGSASAGR